MPTDMPERVAIEADELYHDTHDELKGSGLTELDARVAAEILARHTAYAKVYAAGRESVWAEAEVEWSARMKDGRSAFAGTFTEGGARRYAAEQPEHLAVFTRRVEQWERVD